MCYQQSPPQPFVRNVHKQRFFFFFHSQWPVKAILTLLFSPRLKYVFIITATVPAVEYFALKSIYGHCLVP